ncbi:NAD(P)-dependent oxidoreductase [Roseospira navarrensis]|uniref:NAD(P)H-binding protein n=1 Tax=Roseospira navarrensis TaxID=140058 RepID=A0A7X2D4I2_9PROT|nr:SDR family oxidoreductase [Roseospira navarrensis]MQX36637.1 NAD(P)H-binding protein [Roseospira navarrensis]
MTQTHAHTPSSEPRAVLVVGATGRVGRQTVARLLDAGHRVTAFARQPETLDQQHPRLSRIAGDARDPAAVGAAMPGHDAVVVTLGAGASRTSDVRSRGTAAVIAAMTAHGVPRLVCQSTLGAHESRGNLNFLWKRILFGLLLRPVLLEHQRQEDLVRASGLDWTIVRPSAFTDGPAIGGFRENFAPDERRLTLKIAVADIAAFLVRQVSDPRYRHRAVGISH